MLNCKVVMFKDFLVSTPDEKGKITTQTRKTQAGKTVYVLYEIGRTYNAAKKYNIPHRVVIGKADPNDPEKMYPNKSTSNTFPKLLRRSSRLKKTLLGAALWKSAASLSSIKSSSITSSTKSLPPGLAGMPASFWT